MCDIYIVLVMLCIHLTSYTHGTVFYYYIIILTTFNFQNIINNLKRNY